MNRTELTNIVIMVLSFIVGACIMSVYLSFKKITAEHKAQPETVKVERIQRIYGGGNSLTIYMIDSCLYVTHSQRSITHLANCPNHK